MSDNIQKTIFRKEKTIPKEKHGYVQNGKQSQLRYAFTFLYRA